MKMLRRKNLVEPSAHSTKSGVTHFACANEAECINQIKKILSYIPQNCEDDAPRFAVYTS